MCRRAAAPCDKPRLSISKRTHAAWGEMYEVVLTIGDYEYPAQIPVDLFWGKERTMSNIRSLDCIHGLHPLCKLAACTCDCHDANDANNTPSDATKDDTLTNAAIEHGEAGRVATGTTETMTLTIGQNRPGPRTGVVMSSELGNDWRPSVHLGRAHPAYTPPMMTSTDDTGRSIIVSEDCANDHHVTCTGGDDGCECGCHEAPDADQIETAAEAAAGEYEARVHKALTFIEHMRNAPGPLVMRSSTLDAIEAILNGF